MITPPPSVVSDLTALVAETRGHNTIISTYQILDIIDEGKYPTTLFWLANYEKSRMRMLSCALRTAGFEPHTRKRGRHICSWKVTA